MNFRHQQILTALLHNPDGLTTAQVFAECKKHKGNEIADNAVASQLLFYLRTNQGFISTLDAVGGKLYQLTELGKKALDKESSLPFVDPVFTELVVDLPLTEPVSLSAQEESRLHAEAVVLAENVADFQASLSAKDEVIQAIATELDVSGLSGLQIGLLAALVAQFVGNSKQPIKDMAVKLSTLGRLSDMMSDDIRLVLREIALDLQGVGGTE